MREENIEKMDFKELRAEVQLLRDELAVFKRKMEDAMYNLDGDNFSGVYTAEQDDMKAQVKITTDAITALVAEKDNFATITMLSDSITSTVSKSLTAYFEQSKMPTAENTSATEKTMLCLYDDEYYYFDDFDNKWKIYPEGGIKTMFKQKGTKFELTGNVRISGSLITTGSISGDRISGGTITGTTITGVTITGSNITGVTITGSNITTALNSITGNGVRLNSAASALEVVYAGTVVGSWAQVDAPGGSILQPKGGGILAIANVTARGKWDFSDCSSIEWGNNAPTN